MSFAEVGNAEASVSEEAVQVDRAAAEADERPAGPAMEFGDQVGQSIEQLALACAIA